MAPKCIYEHEMDNKKTVLVTVLIQGSTEQRGVLLGVVPAFLIIRRFAVFECVLTPADVFH